MGGQGRRGPDGVGDTDMDTYPGLPNHLARNGYEDTHTTCSRLK